MEKQKCLKRFEVPSIEKPWSCKKVEYSAEDASMNE
jgi:hypothetical protein